MFVVCSFVYPVTPPLTREDLPAILDHLEPLDDWRSLGLELRVPGRKLTHIQQKYPVESLERVVLFWLEEGPKENCSWRYLADALRKIDRRSIANVIIKKYLAGLGILTSKTGQYMLVIKITRCIVRTVELPC